MGLGDVIDSGDFNGMMDDAMSDIDWAGFEARRKQSEAAGKLRFAGIGLALVLLAASAATVWFVVEKLPKLIG